MDFNITNEDTSKKVDYSIIEPLLTKITDRGVVSRADVLSLESKLGVGVIPNRLKNMVSTVASKHGYSELLDLVRRSTREEQKITYITLLKYLHKQVVRINSIDIDVLVNILLDELKVVNKLYVSSRIASLSLHDTDINNAGALLVNRVISGTFAAEVYSNTNIKTLRYLASLERTVPYGLLVTISGMVDSGYPEIDYKKVIASYDGTVADYISDTVRLLKTINTGKLPNLISVIAEGLSDDAMGYPSLSNETGKLICGTYSILRRDNYLDRYINFCPA